MMIVSIENDNLKCPRLTVLNKRKPGHEWHRPAVSKMNKTDGYGNDT